MHSFGCVGAPELAVTMRQCGARMQRGLPARGGVDWSRFQSQVEYIIYELIIIIVLCWHVFSCKFPQQCGRAT